MSQFSEEQLKKFDYSGITKSLLGDVTSTKVVCKDGTIKYQQSSPNAIYGDACADNGGRAENKSDYSRINEALINSIPFVRPSMQKPIYPRNEIERQQNLAYEKAKLDAEKSMSDAEKNNTKEIAKKNMTLTHIGLFLGGLAVGYFVFKKFKK